jgi:serine/threonine protein kinase
MIFIIDLGMAALFRSPETKRHIPFIDGKMTIGSSGYMAVSAHLGHEQSRKCDLESLGYMLLYFRSGGRLPWQGIKIEGSDKLEKVKQIKMTLSVEQMCKGLPIEFQLYFEHIKSLGFEDRPDYDYLR